MFERKSMEQLVQDMIDWTRGVTTRLTDFRVGSKIRTIYEVFGLELEKLYDKMFRSIRKANEENLYMIMDFDRLPAVNASGKVRFSRTTPADTNYMISAGTIVTTKATAVSAPIRYATTEDAVLASGQTSVDVNVVCLEAGSIGNQDAGRITEFTIKPAGVDAVTNPTGFANGRDEETKEEQKLRFTAFMNSRTRGTLESCAYGATTAELKDEEGNVIERVLQAVAFEDLITKPCEIDVYIWNGVGEASEELKDEVLKVLTGYRNPDTGEPVYGYKPAGVFVNIYSALAKDVIIKLEVEPENWTTLEALKPTIESKIDAYFAGMRLGQTAYQTALEADIKFIDGVKDVKLWFSTDDGSTFNQDNVTAQGTEVLVIQKRIQYE